MADRTKIEWSDATWNPITGCSVISPGCKHCYAMKLAGTRMKHHASRQGLTIATDAGPVWNGQVRFNEQWLDQPLKWKRPRKIFVCAHGDLFHESVPDDWIDQVFAVMALAPQHTFQVLTKRAGRMRSYMTTSAQIDIPLEDQERRDDIALEALAIARQIMPNGEYRYSDEDALIQRSRWPLPNVWLGVSVEDQQRADERIPHLLATPAAKRFISAEPLLGPVDLTNLKSPTSMIGADAHGISALWREGAAIGLRPMLDWVIAGGESGPNARPTHPDWARSLRDQCLAAGVPYFFKQWGEWLPGENLMETRPVGPARWQDGETGRHSLSRDDSKGPEWRHFGTPGEAGAFALKVGKKRAGALLDGREWREMPADNQKGGE